MPARASSTASGSEALLAVGVKLEVKGKLSADGTMLQAERISFGD